MADTKPLLETIRVDLGARSYDIKIGEALLQNADHHMAPLSKTGMSSSSLIVRLAPYIKMPWLQIYHLLLRA